MAAVGLDGENQNCLLANLAAETESKGCAEDAEPGEPVVDLVVGKHNGNVYEEKEDDLVLNDVEIGELSRGTSNDIAHKFQWTCNRCGQENRAGKFVCALCNKARPLPRALLAASGLSICLLIFSGLLAMVSTRAFVFGGGSEDKLQLALRMRDFFMEDARSWMNLGHAGLIVIFTGTYWLTGKLYFHYHVVVSFSLIGVMAVAASTISLSSFSKLPTPSNLTVVEGNMVVMSSGLLFILICAMALAATCGQCVFSFHKGTREVYSLCDPPARFPRRLMYSRYLVSLSSICSPCPRLLLTEQYHQQFPLNSSKENTLQFYSKALHYTMMCQASYVALRAVYLAARFMTFHSEQQWTSPIQKEISGYVEAYTSMFHQVGTVTEYADGNSISKFDTATQLESDSLYHFCALNRPSFLPRDLPEPCGETPTWTCTSTASSSLERTALSVSSRPFSPSDTLPPPC